MASKNKITLSNLPSLDENQLLPYLDRTEIIMQTVEQIKKDFDFHELQIQLHDYNQNVYQKLSEQIEPFVLKLIENNYQQLLQLLYRIDVSEKAISKSTADSNAISLSSEITKLIILRELQKVVIRNYYKS